MSALILRRWITLSAFNLSVVFLVSGWQPEVASAETYVQFAGRMMSEGHFRADIEQALFLKVNAYRRAQGLGQLKPDQTLQFAARAHAQDMATHNFVGHKSSGGYDFESRMRAFKGGGMLVLPSMGENAADYVVSANPDQVAEGLLQEWLHSPPHREAIVSRDYMATAIGVSVGANNKAYADQIFVGAQVHTNMFPTAQ